MTRDFGTLQSRIASDESRIAELWCFLCYLLWQIVEQTGMHSETPWRSCDDPVMSCNFEWKVTSLTCTTYFLGAAICPDELDMWACSYQYIYIKDPLYNILINVLLEKKYGGEGGGVVGGAPSKSALGPRTDGWITQNHAFNSLIRPDHEFCTWICPDRLLTGYAGVPLVTWIVTNLSMPWISNYIHQFKLQ